jgi:hypothetical protein
MDRSPVVDHPGDWCFEPDRVSCCHRERADFQAGPRPRRVARAGAETDDHRRQAEAAGHHETGQRISAQDDHPRSSGCIACPLSKRDAARSVVAQYPCARAREHRRGRAGQQAGAYRLGRAADRSAFQCQGTGGSGLAGNRVEEVNRRELPSKSASGKR